ncbi:MAG: exopolyphosphatase, partial [Xanthomonadales bacterium]|nr:exopolyphosphatase [Xanthomonadales bacterium]
MISRGMRTRPYYKSGCNFIGNILMNSIPESDTYAAVDLGSNSFHMLVARREHGEMRVLDRIKEMVRLGGGLDSKGNLDPEVKQRALECLSRFGQRLRGIPAKNIRAVGTQTFRRLRKANEFLLEAEQALECPVDIIAGREEARLIYLGVTQWIAGHRQKQLVIDIGGGSTELIIGEGFDPVQMESLQFGCVSVTNRFFADGEITAKKLKKAQRAVAAELQEIQTVYRKAGWQRAIGSSGTIRSAAAICEANGWGKKGITPKALEKLKQKALSFKTISDVDIDGLSERRQPVFIGGLAILLACFKALRIKELVISPYALREGLLHDLLGRLEHRDPRDKAVKALMSRFAVDPAQVERVSKTALDLFDQLAIHHNLSDAHRRMLGWACELHEIGLSLSHASYQRHSAYLIEASDMAGFSRQEQNFLTALVGYQRRDIQADFADDLPKRMRKSLPITLLCMRLAWIFCRTREDEAIPDIGIDLDESSVSLSLSEIWMENHPLTIADLEYEILALTIIDLQLQISYTSHE